MALPGIGDYTAGAILSIAFGVPIPAVDGNVLRILSRFTGSDLIYWTRRTGKSSAPGRRQALPAERPGAFNQALMDLGSAVCLRPPPRCGDCPLAHLCAARQGRGKQAVLPVRTPKREKTPGGDDRVPPAPHGRRRGLMPSSSKGLLAGLWEYPNIPGLLTEVSAPASWPPGGLAVQRWEKSWRAKHVFTHVRWDMQGYAVTVTGDGELEWYTAEQRRQMAIPSAFGESYPRFGRIGRRIKNGTAYYFKYGAMGPANRQMPSWPGLITRSGAGRRFLVKPQLDTRDGDHMVRSRIGWSTRASISTRCSRCRMRSCRNMPASLWMRPSFSPRRRFTTWSIWWTIAASPLSATV